MVKITFGILPQKKMKKKSSKHLLKITTILHNFESIAFGKTPEENRYFQTSDGGRFIKVSSFNRRNTSAAPTKSENPDLCVHPSNIKEHLRWCKRCLFDSVVLPSNADVILLRANISLFYLQDAIRIKINVGNPERPAEGLKTEYALRKRVEKMDLLKVPRLLEGRFEENSSFLMDEVIPGRLLTWEDQGAEAVFRRLIPDIWKYYQSVGIEWMTPGERGDDVDKVIHEYTQALEAKPEICFPFDLKKIEGFRDRILPCAQIHGDLAIHNIIVSPDGDFLVDWESSTFDYLIRDFHKLLIIDEWHLDRQIRPLMEIEIEEQRKSTGNAPLSFNDQLYWILFLEVHNMVTTPSYPQRLLRKAQNTLDHFFLTTTRAADSL